MSIPRAKPGTPAWERLADGLRRAAVPAAPCPACALPVLAGGPCPWCAGAGRERARPGPAPSEARERGLALVAAGHSIREAARLAGVNPRTLTRYITPGGVPLGRKPSP